MRGPVTTVYEHPEERVVFHEARDYNVAFVLYEALWMLAGRQDVAPLLRYVKDFDKYSDDGKTLHGAYGYRWLHTGVKDQLAIIADRLRRDPLDRRAVLQIWDSRQDLGVNSKDIPCNLTVTFQTDHNGHLDMVVFCRSNDMIWGAYYANAFHFSLLQEYMSRWIGCPVGTYTQISVNYHAYLDILKKVSRIPHSYTHLTRPVTHDPYRGGATAEWKVIPTVLPGMLSDCDVVIGSLLRQADEGFKYDPFVNRKMGYFYDCAKAVLWAHDKWRTLSGSERFTSPIAILQQADQSSDLVQSMTQWIRRRQARWLANLIKEDVG